ncbi:hypothetical protein EPI10_021404 [Gossypium australe]|uniref:Uncharacterized protein n=1 Tax=Gossypium australe TaxID=47621 RepID=A0A5B6WI57_9ROSI|nr:hypothetical protein EPI10_021404 [Gossypium australe]
MEENIKIWSKWQIESMIHRADWASSLPVGFAGRVRENTQCVSCVDVAVILFRSFTCDPSDRN